MSRHTRSLSLEHLLRSTSAFAPRYSADQGGLGALGAEVGCVPVDAAPQTFWTRVPGCVCTRSPAWRRTSRRRGLPDLGSVDPRPSRRVWFARHALASPRHALARRSVRKQLAPCSSSTLSQFGGFGNAENANGFVGCRGSGGSPGT